MDIKIPFILEGRIEACCYRVFSKDCFNIEIDALNLNKEWMGCVFNVAGRKSYTNGRCYWEVVSVINLYSAKYKELLHQDYERYSIWYTPSENFTYTTEREEYIYIEFSNVLSLVPEEIKPIFIKFLSKINRRVLLLK